MEHSTFHPRRQVWVLERRAGRGIQFLDDSELSIRKIPFKWFARLVKPLVTTLSADRWSLSAVM